MEGTDGDDYFFDDGFEDISANALYELEQNAVQASQRNSAPASSVKQHYPRATVSRIAEQPNLARKFVRKDPVPQIGRRQQASSDYGELNELDGGLVDDGNTITPRDEEDTNVAQYIPGEATQREQWRLQRFGQPTKAVVSSLEARRGGVIGAQAATGRPVPYYGAADDVEMRDAAVDEISGTSGVQDSIAALKAQLADVC